MLGLLCADFAHDDRAAALVAIHALVSERPFRDAFVARKGVHAVAALVAKRSPTPLLPTALCQRESARLGGGPAPRVLVDEDAASPPDSPDSSSLDSSGPSPAKRVMWNAAIRTLAKLMVCSPAACAAAIDSGALALLAKAAQQGQPMDIRLRAAAGLAAIAAWSGPRRAVEIVETEHVVASMTALLGETDDRIPGDLRNATIDGLVVMSFRRHARRVLQKHGAEEMIKAAARHATVSGDYAAAARGTVAAGQISGRSIDEYGFLVEDEVAKKKATALGGGGGGGGNDDGEEDDDDNDGDDSRPRRKKTGLMQLQQQLLEEPYTSVEDLNVLEEIVHEEAGVLSSSPRDRHYFRRAARTYGVSVDEIDFMSALEDEMAAAATTTNDDPTSRTQSAPGATALDLHKLSVRPFVSSDGKDLSAALSSPDKRRGVVDTSEIRPVVEKLAAVAASPTWTEATGSDRSSRPPSGPSNAFHERNSGSSPQQSSNLLLQPMQDPDFDRNFRDGDDESASTATAASSKSKLISPLLMFSSATKRAAERDGKNNHLQKTNSQLTRETEHERVWKEVIENRPNMLRRERGRSSRVTAYRELALVPVPPPLRRKLWPILLNTASLRQSKPNLYANLCKGANENVLPDDIEHTIEVDVTRTMPLHSLFWSGGAQVGVQSLRSILRAYARYVPEVGYCQGMSSIAAVLIMNAEDEEEAFLMMVQFMSRFQYKKVFAPGFPLMLQWISELKPLVAHYMPELNAHFEKENVALELYADKWLITALSHNFPHRHLLRVWDLMFLGGSPKVILKACLAVLKRCESRLLTMDFETMMPFLQRGFAEAEASVLDLKDAEPFIAMMREFRFLPDIPKTQSKTGTQSPPGRTQSSRNQRREGRLGGSCFPCFKRSQTVD